jgi:lipoprotein NlpD
LNKPFHKKLLVLALAFLFLLACASPSIKKSEMPPGVYHRVKKGDTLWNISRAYNKDILDLVVINKMTDPNAIEVDSIIFIPGADHIEETQTPAARPPVPKKEEAKSDILPSEKQTTNANRKSLSEQPVASAIKTPSKERQQIRTAEKSEQKKPGFDSRFVWPVKGTVISKFGIQHNGLMHNGIRISAKEGTPIIASAAGEVMFSSLIKYYGETIIIKHDSRYSTVYTFLKDKRVKVGDRVKKGEKIASLGRAENGNGKPCLNFEIRQNNKPRNPLSFLP